MKREWRGTRAQLGRKLAELHAALAAEEARESSFRKFVGSIGMPRATVYRLMKKYGGVAAEGAECSAQWHNSSGDRPGFVGLRQRTLMVYFPGERAALGRMRRRGVDVGKVVEAAISGQLAAGSEKPSAISHQRTTQSSQQLAISNWRKVGRQEAGWVAGTAMRAVAGFEAVRDYSVRLR